MTVLIRTGTDAARHLGRNLWSRPVLSSDALGWQGLTARRYADCAPAHVVLPPLDDHILVFTTRGITRIDGRMSKRMQGVISGVSSFFLTPRSTPAEWINSHTVDVLHLYLQPSLLETILSEHDGAAASRLELRELYAHSDPLLEQLALGLLRELEHNQPEGAFYASTLISAIGAHLLRHYSNLAQHSRAQLDAPDRQLSRAQIRLIADYIHAHLADPLTVKELAGLVHLSPYHFTRSFKLTTRQSVHQYVISQRIDRARQLLQDPTLRVADVAAAVGFHDHAHLVRHFTRIVGMPPRAYRKALRNPFTNGLGADQIAD